MLMSVFGAVEICGVGGVGFKGFCYQSHCLLPSELSLLCWCVYVRVCLHCPQIGSDDAMLTSQDALALQTFIPSLPDS